MIAAATRGAAMLGRSSLYPDLSAGELSALKRIAGWHHKRCKVGWYSPGTGRKIMASTVAGLVARRYVREVVVNGQPRLEVNPSGMKRLEGRS